MRRLIVLLVLIGGAVWAAVALATPGHGQTNTILSVGTLQADLAFNTGLTAQANGLTWRGKQYSADQLPEFLMQLRTAGVTNVGEWLNLHPAVSAKFGMVPVGLLHSPEVVTQQARFAPGATSGWHSHPGYVTGTVVSGRSRVTAPTLARDLAAGQSFYETAANPFLDQEREQRGRGDDGDLRRSRRHAPPPGFGSTGRSLDLQQVIRLERICERPPGVAAVDVARQRPSTRRRPSRADGDPRERLSAPARTCTSLTGRRRGVSAGSSAPRTHLCPRERQGRADLQRRRSRRDPISSATRRVRPLSRRGARALVRRAVARRDAGRLRYLRRRTLDRRRGAGAPLCPVSLGSPDELARSATAALQRLAARMPFARRTSRLRS